MTNYTVMLVVACVAALLGFVKIAILIIALRIALYMIYDSDKKVPENDFKVCIVGAGFSGIAMGIKMKKIGVDYEIYESADRVGGTWRDSVYPGCGCDIQSHLYSYSFELNPNWTKKYAQQPEILAYLENVAAKYDLNIKFKKRVEKVTWNTATQDYRIDFSDGTQSLANFVVHACGPLREPTTPNFRGREKFRGPNFHTAEWDHSVDLTGKRVAIIGTGATAVQVVPAICQKVEKLFVFQRTPGWVMKRNEWNMPEWAKKLFAFPGFMFIWRLWLFLVHECRWIALFPTWSLICNYVTSWLRKEMVDVIRNGKDRQVELEKKLIPNFAIGCKRMTPSDNYLQAFNRPNVELVTAEIDEFLENGIRTKDGNVVELDIIVYATGYSPKGSLLNAFEIVNGQGETLKQATGDCPRYFLGMSLPKFPNLFCLMGPNTGTGHTSVVWLAECQINHIASLIRQMVVESVVAVSPTQAALGKFYKIVHKHMRMSVAFKGCRSWYRTEDGTGENFVLWPSCLLHFWWCTASSGIEDYETERSKGFSNDDVSNGHTMTSSGTVNGLNE